MKPITEYRVAMTVVIIKHLCEATIFRDPVVDDATSNISIFSLDIIGKCFNEKNELLVVTRNSDCNYKFVGSEGSVDLRTRILIGVKETESVENYTPKVKNYRINTSNPLFKPIPAKKIVILEQNLTSLNLTMYQLKNSVLWNASGLFFIERTRDSNTCGDVYDYIKLIWKFNVLSAVYLCRKEPTDIFLFVFNPYNSYAPEGWNRHGKFKQWNNHSLIVFKRQYNYNSKSFCSSLVFDKTFTVSGYALKVRVSTVMEKRLTTSRIGFRIFGIQGFIWKTIFDRLNITLTKYVTTRTHVVSMDGVPNKDLIEFHEGLYDMNSVFEYERDLWKNEMNSFIPAALCYVIQQENITLAEKVFNWFSINIFIFIIIFSSIMTVSLSYLLKISYIDVLLDLLRALVGVSMIKRSTTSVVKILLITLTVFCMILSLYLSGELSSFLTTAPIRNIHIEKIDDLIALDYKIYTIHYLVQYYFNVKKVTNIVILDNFEECLAMLSTGRKIACIADCYSLSFIPYNRAETKTFQDSKIRRYNVLTFRDDFPLRDAFNNIYHRLFECGIVKFIIDVDSLRVLKDTEEKHFKKISFHQMKFCFGLLTIGYGTALTLFLVELIIEYYRNFMIRRVKKISKRSNADQILNEF